MKKTPTKKLIIANWKMNPGTLKEAVNLFGAIKNLGKTLGHKGIEIVVCPPFPFIGALTDKVGGKVFLGAQDLFFEKEGAFTGEVSASQLASAKASYVIVGHSERRRMGETSDLVAKKVAAALTKKIMPIVCVGEKERDTEGAFFHVLHDELLTSLQHVAKKDIAKVVIAYEPVWAISTQGKGAMAPNDIAETIIYLKKVLADKYGKASAKTKILYGGSVDPFDAPEIFKAAGVDGALIGKASLSAAKLEKIFKAV